MKKVRVDITTVTDGSCTAYGEAVVGLVYAVQLVDGTLADGVDVTVTSENQDLSIPILVKADFNTDQVVYPRVVQALNTDGTSLTSHAFPLCYGRPKVVIAAGGSVATGAVVLYLMEV